MTSHPKANYSTQSLNNPIRNNSRVITTVNKTSIRIRAVNTNKTVKLSTSYDFHRMKLQVDLDFAKRLRQAQKRTNIPMVNDIIVSKRNGFSSVYVIINNGNTNNGRYKKWSSYDVELIVKGKIYKNVFSQVEEGHLRVLKYEVPDMPQTGTVSVNDHSTSARYNNLPYKILAEQPRRKIAVCAYISNFNTINEIKSLLAFYILQNVDNVILYCTVKCDYFKQSLKKEIASGYVILYEYPWPLTRLYGLLQRSIQGSHINSCYYRHRDYFEYIIFQDVDEYFYSEKYPYNLYKAVCDVYELNPDNRSLPVVIGNRLKYRWNRLFI